MDNKETLRAVVRSLNLIEVHGKNNLDYMLGCIQAVNSVIENMIRQESDSKKEEEVNG